jgi:hypothetical protein
VQVALEELLAQTHDIALVADGPADWVPSIFVRRLRRLAITVG